MEQSLRLAGIVRESVVDGPGWRFTVFVQGCPHRCPGCHNPQTHDFAAGFSCTIEKLLAEIKKNPLLRGVTFSGGEPFCQGALLAKLGKELKALGKDVVTYTGYTFEELLDLAETEPAVGALLAVTDLLIDGKFVLAQKDLTLRFRGSSNQRILNAAQSLLERRAVAADSF